MFCSAISDVLKIHAPGVIMIIIDFYTELEMCRLNNKHYVISHFLPISERKHSVRKDRPGRYEPFSVIIDYSIISGFLILTESIAEIAIYIRLIIVLTRSVGKLTSSTSV